MNHENYQIQLENWLSEQNDIEQLPLATKGFIGDRPYRHFDARISISELQSNEAENLLNLLRYPSRLKLHGFYPFVRKDSKVRRFTKERKKVTLERYVRIKQKLRPIMYASHKDAVIFGFYGWLLKRLHEEDLNKRGIADSVIAYRKISRNDNSGRNKSNIDFAKDIFNELSKQNNAAVMCLDISDFFGSMNHQELKSSWNKLLGTEKLPVGHDVIFKNITRYRYIFVDEVLVLLGYGKVVKGKFVYSKKTTYHQRSGPFTKSPTYNKKIKNSKSIRINGSPKGIPQGSPISDVLANIYLSDFDTNVNNLLKANGGGLYKRYSDDILIICQPNLAQKIYEIVHQLLADLNLKVNEKKTELFFIDRKRGLLADNTALLVEGYTKNRTSIQYLGFEFDLTDIHVRAATISNYYRKFIRSIKRGKPKAIDPYIVPAPKEPSPKKTTVKKSRRDRYAYIKIASKRIKSNRLTRQFGNVRKRSAKLRRNLKK